MDFKYFDIHSHLNLQPLRNDEEAVVFRMRAHETATITVGVDAQTSRDAVLLAEKYPFFWATVGLHPTDNTSEAFDFEEYKKIAAHPRVVAIGECGLDYFRNQTEETKNRQKEVFKQHIMLALELNKPLMIHARPSKGSMDAYSDVLAMLEPYQKTIRANFHFFVGNKEIAMQVLALGFTISFDGPITFARDYDEVIQMVPLESLMAETDAPFAAPVPYRGKTCEPWMVEEVVKKIAEIRNEDFEKVRAQLLLNAMRFTGLTPLN